MAKPDPETRLEPDTDRTKPRAQRPGSLKSPDLSEKTNPGPNQDQGRADIKIRKNLAREN